MNKLHERLAEESGFYRDWHNHKATKFFHWYAFVVLSLLFAFLVIGNINQYGEDSIAAVGGIGSEKYEEYVLVKFKANAGFDRRSIVSARHNLREEKASSELSSLGLKRFKVPPGRSAIDVASEINVIERDSIDYAESDSLDYPALLPNDPMYAGSQGDKAMMNMPTAWDITTGNPNMVIAILDTGVNCNHADISGLCVAGRNTASNNSDTSDIYGHGTAVAGVAAARGNNSLGVAGGAWSSKIMPIRITDNSSTGSAYSSAQASGIVWAADNGAKVISMSYGGKSQAVRDAASYADKKGAVVIVSAGNTGTATTYNSDWPEVTTVGAATSINSLASYSTYGNDVDIVAPGCTGATTASGGGYRSFCGTSNSAPEIAGVVALIRSANSSLSPAQVRDVLYSTAIDSGTAGRDPFFGWGFVDAGSAVTKASGTTGTPTPEPEPTVPSAPTISASTSNTCGGYTNISWNNVSDATSYKIYRDNSLINSNAKSPFTDGSLNSGTSYSYLVRATNSVGDSPNSNTASATASPACSTTPEPTPTPTPTPTLSISNHTVSGTSNSLTVTWQTNIPATGAVLYGTKSNLLSSTINSSSGTQHSVTITGLSGNSNYWYKIVANSSDPSLTTSTGTLKTRTSR